MSARRILYLQHATELGGSTTSLLYLIQQLDRSRYEPLVACSSGGDADAVVKLYRDHGIPTVQHDLTFAYVFMHNTGGWWPLSTPSSMKALLGWVRQFGRARRVLRSLLRATRPDLVHFNSLTLAPYAPVVKAVGLPLVVHVRESVHAGHVGVRRWWLTRLLDCYADEVIYLSQHDQDRLTGRRKGVIVPDFVDFSRFDRSIDPDTARRRLGLNAEDQVVLYLGGLSEIKGILPLLDALRMARSAVPRLVCLMPLSLGALPRVSSRGRMHALLTTGHWRTYAERVEARIRRDPATATCLRRMPFRDDIPDLLAASDLVVFPSVAPHFARPVVEAGAMARPVVASRIGGVSELVVDGETGILVTPGDAEGLARAILRVLDDPGLKAILGEGGYRQARRRFDAEQNARVTQHPYERLT